MRNSLIIFLYKRSKKIYQNWYKSNSPWKVTISQLLEMDSKSIGYNLGVFLKKNDFKLEAKLENHDVFHIITGINTSVIGEISLQFFLLGNGKRSPYLIMVILIGLILYIDKAITFKSFYTKGKRATPFYQLDFEKLLDHSLDNFKLNYII